MMKKFFLGALVVFCTLQMLAQVKVGIKAGVLSSIVNDEGSYTFDSDGIDALKIQFNEAPMSLHGGLYMQATLGTFMIRPEVVYSTNKHSFLVEDITNMSPPTIMEEAYHQLDIPLLFGFKLGPLRLNAGPVGHLHMGSSSDLTNIDTYRGSFEELTYGWQGGIGLHIKRLNIDVRYEGNFNKFGDHITIMDNNFNFDSQEARFMASIGFDF